MKRWLAIGGATLGLVMAATPGTAADGRLEINQSCAAVGCFAGDTPGFPVTVQTAGSYLLTSNLTVAGINTDAIALYSGITLDLNGFTIAGPANCVGSPATCEASGTGTGVYSGGHNAIRNGRIKGMGGNGIVGGDYTRVEAVEVEGNGYSGISGLDGSAGWIIERCNVHSNAQLGIDLYYGQGGANQVSQNSVRSNGDIGIRAPSAIVRGNTVHQNGGVGFFGGPTAGLVDNVFTSNNGGSGNAQISGSPTELGENLCGTNATCP